MREVGANTFVLGNTGIFKRSPDIREAWRLTMDAYEHSTGEIRPIRANLQRR